ncbi:hypothetical protein ACFQV4_02975 [Streptomyces thermocarboxydus]
MLSRANVIGFTTLLTLTVVAAFLNRMFAREREQLRTSRQVAEAVQRAMLPTVPERARGWPWPPGTRPPRRRPSSAATCTPCTTRPTGCAW